MTRVVFAHPSDEMYGADKVLLELVEAAALKWEVEVWLPDDIEYPDRYLSTALAQHRHQVRRLPLPVLRRAYLTPRRLVWYARVMFRGFQAMRRIRPDLLYVNTLALAPLATIAALLGLRSVVHVHENVGGLEKLILNSLIWPSSRIVIVSRGVLGSLSGTNRSRSVVIHNGFDLGAAMAPLDESGPLRVLIASRWNRWKGHAPFLEAWGRVARPDVRLAILGGVPEVGDGVDVRALVADLPNASKVNVVGETRDIRRWLGWADVVVVPSVEPDPLPTIAIEAHAAGRCVLASDLGGLPEIVDDGVTGWLLPAGDVDRWAAAIEALDRRDCHSRGVAARDRYEREFRLERFRLQAVGLMAEVLSEVRGTGR